MNRLACLTLLLSGLLLRSTFAESAPNSDPGPAIAPIQAELLAYLNVRHLSNGDTVFARVTADWNGMDCSLRQGAIIEATVAAATPHGKASHGSQLALSFPRAQCNGSDLAPMEFVLAAIAGVQNEWSNKTDGGTRIPISFSNPNASGMTAGFGSATAGDRTITHLDFKGVSHHFPMHPKLLPGEVIDIKGLKLDIGTGPNRSSVLSAKDRDVSLDKYTQFLLVPSSLAFQPSPAPLMTPAVATADAPLPPKPRTTPAIADLETCAPPGCAVDLPVSSEELTGNAASSIAIGPLGYAPRPHKVLTDFDDEEALAWLGPQQLLLTLNPHTLIQRRGPADSGGTLRVIRAVLLDADKHNVLQVVDWEMNDYNRYLWQLDGNRILVHVSNELRVYGPGLAAEARIPLPGPLAFVRIAPNGELMTVATSRERHSQELHAKLRENSGADPEEDVDVLILNKEFKTIGEASTTSGLLPPTLLNEGQVKLLAQPKMRYRLAMNTWENKSITLARFDSLCTPELSAVPPDLLFLLSCDTADGATQYRVFQPDGKLILSGKSGPQEVGQDAIGNSHTRTFAMKVVRATQNLSPGAEFQGAQLDFEEVRVYRASDGKRLLAVRVDDPPTNRSGYALSPDGSQLAVLTGSQIRLFPVPSR
jgi:hypothetical protein